jgi:DNA-binding NtrC family response regulator
MLDAALQMIVEMTDAQIALVELFDSDGTSRFWRGAPGTSDKLDELRRRISTGIVGTAMNTGETICTSSAQAEPRFADLDSVRQHQIDAVLCSPIGEQMGVIYLQGRSGDGEFTPQDRQIVELTADHVAHVATRFVDGIAGNLRRRQEAFTRQIVVETLDRHDRNVSATAKSLGLDRSQLYALMNRLGIDYRD